MKFLPAEVALYLYKSTIRPCMEYCCDVCGGVPSCYMELLDKLQKRIAGFFYCDIYVTKSCWLSNTCTSLKAIYTQNQRKFNFRPH